MDIDIEYQKSLKSYNTFGIDVNASAFITITSEELLLKALQKYKDQPVFILSGGSNMVLTKPIEIPVLHIAIKGISIEEETNTTVLVSANAGENWHDFVQYCIEHHYGGLENLSLIPGYVGSTPIQNIGAYGVEIKDCFVSCEAIHIKTGNKKVFSNEACHFGYRNSIFKNELKGEYVITKVTFRLTTKNHVLNTSYGAIETYLSEHGVKTPTLRDVSNAVIHIRKSKLPDPKEIGNSGSFFKNPVIPIEEFRTVQKRYPDIKFYTIDENRVKVPAGWLIEQCGFKGKRWGDAGVHDKQSLVLVNYANATGEDIVALSKKIQNTVKDRFGIHLETEVNII